MNSMPMPGSLAIFLAVGNETAELAGHIVSSMDDHVPAEHRPAMACVSLVDERFDQAHALHENLHYQYTAKQPLVDTALTVVNQTVTRMMEALFVSGLTTGVTFSRVSVTLLVDAAGRHALAELEALRERLVRLLQEQGRDVDVLLCLLANNKTPQRQRAWLLDHGELRPEIQNYRKVLLLTPQRLNGLDIDLTAREMLDAVLPAMLLILNGHEMNMPTRLYTAAFTKAGGTSNDILELKQHIAAEVLDGYFANSSGLTDPDVWAFLSTPEVDLTHGKSAADRVRYAAQRHVPTLEHLVLNADLESKDFDPVQHILDFDEMNVKAMTSLSVWPERWLTGMKAKLSSEVQRPDGFLQRLEENAPMATEILSAYRQAYMAAEQFADTNAVRHALQTMNLDIRRPLMKARQDHHLMLLSVAVEAYQDVCVQRIAYALLDALQKGLGELRTALRAMKESRQHALRPYMMPEAKAAMLRGMCPDAAMDLQQSYSQSVQLELLNTYLLHSHELYSPDGEPYWRSLYTEFKNRGKPTSSFSAAFLQGKDPHALLQAVMNMSALSSPMLPKYPDVLGAMPSPASYYLVNNSIAERLGGVQAGFDVYGIPGDLREHLSLYALSDDLSILPLMSMFRESAELPEADSQLPVAISAKPQDVKAPAVIENGNFWNVKVRMLDKGLLLSFDWPDPEEVVAIRLNGRELTGWYTYGEYIRNAHSYRVAEEDLPPGNLRFAIECGGERQEYVYERKDRGEEVIPRRSGRVKAKASGPEFQRGCVDMEGFRQGKLLRLNNGKASFRMRVPWDGNENIGPLWFLEDGSVITLEDEA